MPKPRLKSEARRVSIIENAAKVFAERGLEGARTRDIAKACDVNEAILYRHFASKQDLFHEVNAWLHARAMDSWKLIVESAPNGLAGLRAAIKARCKIIFSDNLGPANMVHAIATATQDRNARKVYANRKLSDHAFLQDLVQRGIDDGSIRNDLDAGKVALLLLGILWECTLIKVLGLFDGRIASGPDELFETTFSRIAAPARHSGSSASSNEPLTVPKIKASGA